MSHPLHRVAAFTFAPYAVQLVGRVPEAPEAIKHPQPPVGRDNEPCCRIESFKVHPCLASKCTVITTAWLRFRIDLLARLLRARLNCRFSYFRELRSAVSVGTR